MVFSACASSALTHPPFVPTATALQPFHQPHAERLIELLQRLSPDSGLPIRGMLVRVASVQGSAPRNVGTWMAVFAHTLIGTIGGGHLEYEVCALARGYLSCPAGARPAPGTTQRFALGPSLGQCCGGVVQVSFQSVSVHDIPALQAELVIAPRALLAPVALFGGGHVGRALVQVLAPLPFAVRWIDSRDDVFASLPQPSVVCEYSAPVQAAVPTLAAQSRVLIMSFSHAEDLDILASCLQRQRQQGDLPYIGLIGSQTKWATFSRRLGERGFGAQELAHVTSPIGVRGIHGKAPEVIAVAVAAQLLQTLAA